MIFDWISPLAQMLSGKESIAVDDVGDIDRLKQGGVRVGSTPFKTGGKWVVTVNDVDKARRILRE